MAYWDGTSEVGEGEASWGGKTGVKGSTKAGSKKVGWREKLRKNTRGEERRHR